MTSGVIYKVTNMVNGKVYVGQTMMSLRRRWYYHCHKSSECTAIHRAIQKYGADSFTIQVIDRADDRAELDSKEAFWIHFLGSMVPNGYNLKTGGNTPTYSEASMQRMSRNHADVSGTNNPRYGVHLSFETRQKIANSHRGKHLSEEHKEKCRLNSPKRRMVKNLDTGDIYPSCRLAEKQCDLAHGTVSRVCQGKGHTSGGFRWCYVEGGDIHV